MMAPLKPLERKNPLMRSFRYALEGILYTLKTQRNMQIHAGAAVFALGMCLHLQIPWRDVMLVFFSIFLVFILEMVNTAIESVVDLVTGEFHPLAKAAKDVAAGAVLLAAFLAIIIGVYVFANPILNLWKG